MDTIPHKTLKMTGALGCGSFGAQGLTPQPTITKTGIKAGHAKPEKMKDHEERGGIEGLPIPHITTYTAPKTRGSETKLRITDRAFTRFPMKTPILD